MNKDKAKKDKEIPSEPENEDFAFDDRNDILPEEVLLPEEELISEDLFPEIEQATQLSEPIQLYLQEINRKKLLEDKDEFQLAICVQAEKRLKTYLTRKSCLIYKRSIRT